MLSLTSPIVLKNIPKQEIEKTPTNTASIMYGNLLNGI